MPPKKKGAAASKISKQELLRESLPEAEISLPELKKIPKKPFFRYVDYDSLAKAQHIRIKLWKIRSSSVSQFEDIYSDDPFGEIKAIAQKKFQTTFKSLTTKKCFKHVKRFEYDPSLFSKQRFIKRICSTWRLHSLFLTVEERFDNYDALWRFLNSSLKNCYLRFNANKERIDQKLVAAFRIMRKGKLVVDSDANDIYIRINPAKLISHLSLKKFCPVKDVDDSGCELVRNHIIVNTPECFEEIWYTYHDVPRRGSKINHDLSFLPNLQELQLSCWSRQPLGKKFDDLSFVKQYPKLKTLGFEWHSCEVETLDYVADLPELKEFTFASVERKGQGPLVCLPNLTQLEKFVLFLSDPPIFTMEHVKDFILKNRKLKELDLGITIQNVGIILEENEDFILPEIEKLRLNLIPLARPYVKGGKKIAEVLETHGSIKELKVLMDFSFADLNATLLKDGIAKMKSLEKLTLQFGVSGGPEENKYKHLKDLFANQTGLLALDLDLSSDTLGTREFGAILDGLMKLKNLKKFRLKAKLAKMTPAVFNKLSDFLGSLRHLKSLEVDLMGISEEDGKKFRQQMLPKVPLSDDFFSYCE